MEKIKKGKLNQPNFWFAILILWGLMAAVMLLGIDTNSREGLSVPRIVILLVLTVIYLMALIMRLEDAGKSKALVLICFVFPIFMFVIGAWPSESIESEENRKERIKAEKKAKKQSQQHGRF